MTEVSQSTEIRAASQGVIFLVHRLPYPPDKGDKIRSFNMLRHLAARYDVHLGCFMDDECDVKHIESLGAYCKSMCIRPLQPMMAKLRSLQGLVVGDALTVPYYKDSILAGWIDKTFADHEISTIITFSSPMGQYIFDQKFTGVGRVMDFVDVDSDKWFQYAKKARFPMKWLYNREAKLLAKFENMVFRKFDASIFVSENETSLFSEQCEGAREKLYTANNGVAAEYFDPALNFDNPYESVAQPIVFTGVMDYWPNVDAVTWFAREVFASVREAIPNAEFWIVGVSPTKEVRAMASIDGIHVTGRVDDVRPYLRWASVAVAPLWIARGVQNKVLEAIAMGIPVVCSPQAAAGLSCKSSAPIKIAESGEGFVNQVLEVIGTQCSEQSNLQVRDYVLEHYDWDKNLLIVSNLVEKLASRALRSSIDC